MSRYDDLDRETLSGLLQRHPQGESEGAQPL